LDPEKELLKELSEFPAVIKEAGIHYSPALIANYVFNLVKLYNSFYQSVSILKEEDAAIKNFRIALGYKVAQSINLSMRLLGVQVPDRM